MLDFFRTDGYSLYQKLFFTGLGLIAITTLIVGGIWLLAPRFFMTMSYSTGIWGPDPYREQQLKRLFPNTQVAAHPAAKKIARLKSLTKRDLDFFRSEGEDSSLLLAKLLKLSLAIGNSRAAEVLLKEGANPMQLGGELDINDHYFSYLDYPLEPKLGPPPGYQTHLYSDSSATEAQKERYYEALVRLVQSFLEAYFQANGDPNVMLPDGERKSLLDDGTYHEQLVRRSLISHFTGTRLGGKTYYDAFWYLLSVGADPWLRNDWSPPPGQRKAFESRNNAMEIIAINHDGYGLLEELIDQGYFRYL